MSDKRVFNKADFLRGKDTPVEVYIKEFECYMNLKPITIGKYKEIKSEMMKSVKIKSMSVDDNSITPDMEANIVEEAAFEGNMKIIKECWVGEEITLDEIRDFPIGAVDAIIRAIDNISGVGRVGDEAADNFRK